MATKRGNVLTQGWRSKSAVFRMYHALSLNGNSGIVSAVKRQRNLGLIAEVPFITNRQSSGESDVCSPSESRNGTGRVVMSGLII